MDKILFYCIALLLSISPGAIWLAFSFKMAMKTARTLFGKMSGLRRINKESAIELAHM